MQSKDPRADDFTDEEFAESWDRLTREVRHFRGQDRQSSAYASLVASATEGDQGLLQSLAWNVQAKLLVGDPLNPPERFLLVWILERLMTEEEVARGASGAPKAGRPRNGMKGLDIALDVVQESHSTSRIDEALENVARKNNVSFDTAKRYWRIWKDVATDLWGDTPKARSERMRSNRRSESQ